MALFLDTVYVELAHFYCCAVECDVEEVGPLFVENVDIFHCNRNDVATETFSQASGGFWEPYILPHLLNFNICFALQF